MMHNGVRSPTIDRHIERIDDEFFTHVVRHRPSNDSTAANVEYNCEKEKARVGRHVRYIGDPKLIGKRSREIVLYQIY